jgi:hypothetical protein
VSGALLLQVDPHVVARRQQQRHDDDRLSFGEGAEGCRDIRLLHVDVPEPDGDVGKPCGDGVDERRDRGLSFRRGRAVGDREQGRCGHGLHCAPAEWRACYATTQTRKGRTPAP